MEGGTIVRNVGSYLSRDRTQHPSITGCSAKPQSRNADVTLQDGGIMSLLR